jgi:MFS family permease
MGFTLASSGDGILYGAVPLLALSVDPHPFAISAVVAADLAPWLLMALPAGVFADRFHRGSVATFANGFRGAVVLLAALLILDGRMTLALLLLVVVVNACARAVYYSSAQAMIPDIVHPELLESANGALLGAEYGAEQLAGPVAGSWLFTLSQSVPFFADTVVLISSCLPFARFRTATKEAAANDGGTSEHAESSHSPWEGIRMLFSDPDLRVLVVLVASLSGLQGMESGVLVLLATTVWGVREGAYGLFLAIGATGSMLGSVVTSGVVSRFGSARTLIGAALFSGIAYLVMVPANSWLVAGPAFVLLGLATGIGSVVATTVRQRLTPRDLMGRVGGAWRGVVWGVAPLGALAAGVFASIGGLRLPLLLAGLLQCAVALVLARPLARRIRDTPRGPSATGGGRHAKVSPGRLAAAETLGGV